MPIRFMHLRDLPLVGGTLSKNYQSMRAAWQERGMRRLYSRFIHPGDLAIDVGANMGSRTHTFLGLGASVVAVEPQHECARALFIKFGANPRFHLVNAALGAVEGQAEMLIANYNMASTLSHAWVEQIRAEGERQVEWKEKRIVTLTTLDALIAQYGNPSFIKIDAEDFDYEVLCGLTSPVPALSFEFHHSRLGSAIKCIERLAGQGYDSMNYIVGEGHAVRLKNWVSPDRMAEELKKIPYRWRLSYGDVYAVKGRG